jgi:hypothetical protein
MATNNENAWLNTLTRESGFRRCLILHGNVNDVCYSVETQNYRPVLDVASRTLKQRGFDEVVSWDRFSGVQNVSAETRESLEREAAMGSQPKEQSTGEDYDMGNDARTPTPGGCAPPNPENFLSVIYYHMLNPKRKRYAFVLDWSDYLFGNANALSESERQWLLILSKSLQNAPLPMDAENIGKPANLVILVCSKLGRIPCSFYQDNPQVKEIVVPMPGRLERVAFVKRNLHLLNFRKVLKPGQVDFDDFIDSLERLTIRDLLQITKLSRQVDGDPLSPDKLLNLYRYGEKTSPWEDLNKDKLKSMEDALKQQVKGQDEAVEKVSRDIIRAYTGLSGIQHSLRQKMPKAILFSVGPPGVGKTQLAKTLAFFLFGDEDALLRFDMSEYNHEHSDQRLVGAPPGYVGYEEGGQLTNAIKKRPYCVVLFDEIEKAHDKILDKFLQILEDGRLTDGKGDTVSFSEAVIIFTSNIGSSEVKVSEDQKSVRQQFIKKVEEHFTIKIGRPEIFRRIANHIVPFNFITGDEFFISIAKAKMEQLKERLREKYRIEDIFFEDEDKSLGAIARTVNRAYGGGGVLNSLEDHLIDPLACFIFHEEENPANYAGRKIRIRQAGDTTNFIFMLE